MIETLTRSAMFKPSLILIFLVCVSYGKPPYQKDSHFPLLNDFDIDLRINGGVLAQKDEFPYQAQLITPYGYLFCGAILISDYYVLTAAHCLNNKIHREIRVRVGDYDWSTNDEATHVDIEITNVTVHPKFNYDTTLHDIAVIRLAEKAPLTPSIMPVCLPPPKRDFSGERAIISGWGSTTEVGFPVEKLHKLTVKILTETKCLDLLRGYRIYYAPQKICGYENKKDMCKGDSGGPLVWTDNESAAPLPKRRFLIGIVSLGFQCGTTGKPGLYTRVSSYLDWIKDLTKDDKSVCFG